MKRINLKNLLMLSTFATMVASVMISCKSSDSDPKDGLLTTISLNITQPTAGTYATDGNAKPSEVALETVDVFIYHNSSSVQYARLSVAQDFTETAPGSNKYTLNSDKKIETTIGKKYIYIGANLPASVVNVLKTNTTLPSTVSHTHDLMNPVNGGFAMVTILPIQTVVAVDPNAPENNIGVSITRVLSKAAGILATTANSSLPGGTIANLQFAISNSNTKFYIIPKKTSPIYNSYEDPNWTIGSAVGDLYKAAASDYIAFNPEAGFDPRTARTAYMLENTSEGFLQNEATYVTIRGQFVPANIVKLTTPGDGSSALIPDAAIALGDTFYTVAPSGVRSFFSKEQDALDYGAVMSAQPTKYTDGWSYYNVFLNPGQPAFGQKYDVIRNCLFNVKITKINNLGAGEDVDGGNVPIIEPIDIGVVIDIEGWEDENIDVELD